MRNHRNDLVTRYPSVRSRAIGGFTLIELMIVIGIVAIIASVAVPGFSSSRDRQAVTAAANEILGMLQVARFEALKRKKNSYLCPINADAVNQYSDVTCLGPDEDWSGGLIVWVDDNRDDIFDAPASDTQLNELVKFHERFQNVDIQLTGGANYPGYAGSIIGTSATDLEIHICPSSGNDSYTRKIYIGAGEPYILEEGVVCP